MKNRFFLVIALSFLVFTSCKTTKQVQKGEDATSVQHLIQLVQNAEPKFETMNASNVSMYISTINKNVSASIRIKTDSVIALSIYPFLGIEMFSIELYQDKWFVYDKMNKRYFTDTYESLYRQFGVKADFNTFQALFSARLFCVGEKEVNPKKCTYVPFALDKAEIKYETKDIKQLTQTSETHMIERVNLFGITKEYSLMMSYKEYIELKGINYPRNIDLVIQAEKFPEVNVSMKISKVTFNSDMKLNLSNPERYTRSTIDQIIKK